MLALHFGKLLAATRPTDVEKSRVLQHAETIKTRLKSSFDLVSVLQIGSYSRDTAIRSQSDLDLLAVFRKAEAQRGGGLLKSTTFIDRVRKDLGARYVHTDVRRDSQAVVVSFGAGARSVDVVPAIFWQAGSSGWPTYAIPDGNGEWLATSPVQHNQYLNRADKASTGKLKNVVRLLKYWRSCRNPNIPLLAFHAELALAQAGIGRGVTSYSQALFEAFELLSGRQGRAIRDPINISGNIACAKTSAMQGAVVTALSAALDHAARARQAELDGDRKEALRQWDIVFNGSFPQRL